MNKFWEENAWNRQKVRMVVKGMCEKRVEGKK